MYGVLKFFSMICSCSSSIATVRTVYVKVRYVLWKRNSLLQQYCILWYSMYSSIIPLEGNASVTTELMYNCL